MFKRITSTNASVNGRVALRRRWIRLGILMAWGAGPAAARAAPPDLSIGAKQFPHADAVHLRWEQHWTIDPDGTIHRRDHRWTKLLNSRPIRRLADPRVDHCEGTDRLIIHTARTIRPGGRTLDVPDYGFNPTAPDDVAGWPEYAAWRQRVISFSGIEPGVVLELDYEVITEPGVVPWLSADLRVDDDDPIVERLVSVTVPDGTALRHRSDHIESEAGEPTITSDDGATTYAWRFVNGPGSPAEPQSPPWKERCGRLRFTTCPGAPEWVAAFVTPIRVSAVADETVRRFAEAAIEDETDPVERVRRIADKLRNSFNFVTSQNAWRSRRCRPALEVLRSNYGNPLESAALLAACLSAVGIDSTVEVGVNAPAWSEQVPTDADFAGVVVATSVGGRSWRVHPQHGVVDDPGSWGKHWLLGVTESGALRASRLYARGERSPSEIQVNGTITIDEQGAATGELRIRLTGAFYDPAKLETAGDQRALVKRVVKRVLTGCEVTDHSIAALSAEVLRFTATVGSDGPLAQVAGGYVLGLGDGPAFLDTVPLPLGRSYRRTDVALRGAIRERVELTFKMPEGWAAPIVPRSARPITGPWGSVVQHVTVADRSVRCERVVEIAADRVAADEFGALRDGINGLRTAGSRRLVFEEEE